MMQSLVGTIYFLCILALSCGSEQKLRGSARGSIAGVGNGQLFQIKHSKGCLDANHGRFASQVTVKACDDNDRRQLFEIKSSAHSEPRQIKWAGSDNLCLNVWNSEPFDWQTSVKQGTLNGEIRLSNCDVPQREAVLFSLQLDVRDTQYITWENTHNSVCCLDLWENKAWNPVVMYPCNQGTAINEFWTVVVAPPPAPPTPAAPTTAPTYATVDGYQRFPNNCFQNHGAVEIGTVLTGHSATSCAAACGGDVTCDCFVFAASDGKCWKRQNCVLDACEGDSNGKYQTYLASEPRGRAYKPFQRDCTHDQAAAFKGISAPSCAAKCGSSSACDCFVYSAVDGQCWLREHCSMRSCLPNAGYVTYLEPRQPQGYIRFEEENCYTAGDGKRHGADNVDHKFWGISASSCAARCNNDPSCDCFVYEDDSATCWKRANCTLSSCSGDRGYATYVTPKPSSHYTAFPSTNCYTHGHGAIGVYKPEGAWPIDVSSCAALCDAYDTCNCFVHAHQFEGTSNRCWLRENCTLNECQNNTNAFETYVVADSSNSMVAMTP